MTSQQTSRRALAVGGIILATAIWGSSFSIIKTALGSVTPLWFIGLRFSGGAVFLALLCIKKFPQINKKLLRDGLILGIPLALSYIFQTVGLLHTTASNNAFITCTYVVIVPFVMWLLYRQIRPANFLIAALTLIGLALLSLNESLHIASGDILTFGCAVLLAIHMVLLGKYSPRHDAFLLTLIQIAMVAVVNTILALIIEPVPIAADFSLEIIGALLFCAIFPTVVCYLIQTAAQKIISPVSASILFMGESIFGAFFGWLLLDEIFSPRQLAGAALLIICMAASVLLDYWPRRPAGQAKT